MSTATPYRVAIIGYGLAGTIFHAALIGATPGLEVAAIVTANAERRARAAHDFPDATLLERAEDLWATPENWDLVVVAATNRVHLPLGLAAMQAGLPVVIDKPLAVSLADAKELIAASHDLGVPLTVYQNRRFDADFQTVQQVIASGALGTIVRFESRYERYRVAPRAGAWRESADPADGGGLLFDLGSHVIDQAHVLFGAPERVYAEVRAVRPTALVDDDTFVALSFANGIVAHLWMSLTARQPGPRFRIIGTQGAFEKFGMDVQEDQLIAGLRPGDAGWGVEPAHQSGVLVHDIADLATRSTITSPPGAYQRFYAQVQQALAGEGSWPVAPAEALLTTRIITAAQQSAREQRVVTLDEIPG
jgi:scyllo-inositol 2-dehydrogenase (NADP+)